MDVKIAAQKIQSMMKAPVTLAVVLGSGLSSFSENLSERRSVLYSDVPGMRAAAVSGHKGEFILGSIGGRDIICLAGRIHCYEGYTAQEVTFYIRLLHELGVKTLILTNAAGAVNAAFHPGDICLITDHIKLIGDSPLTGPEFLDMQNAYSPSLRGIALSSGNALGISIRQGVYMYFKGPQYETPAEIKAAGALGADMVGMSTVPEVIMARALKMEVLALSLITNMAAGVTGQAISHDEVKEAGDSASAKFSALMSEIIKTI